MNMKLFRATALALACALGLGAYADNLKVIEQKGKFGYSTESGRVVVKPKYTRALEFQNGYGRVFKGEKEGLVNAQGKEFVACKYDSISDFRDGIAWVGVNGKWGLVNEAGKIITKPDFSVIEDFQGNYARVKKNNLWGMVNRTGKLIIPCKYGELEYPIEDYARAQKDGKWGMLNAATGKEAIKCDFQSVGLLNQGYSIVGKDDKWGVYSPLGKEIVKVKNRMVLPLTGNKFYVLTQDSFWRPSHWETRSTDGKKVDDETTGPQEIQPGIWVMTYNNGAKDITAYYNKNNNTSMNHAGRVSVIDGVGTAFVDGNRTSVLFADGNSLDDILTEPLVPYTIDGKKQLLYKNEVDGPLMWMDFTEAPYLHKELPFDLVGGIEGGWIVSQNGKKGFVYDDLSEIKYLIPFEYDDIKATRVDGDGHFLTLVKNGRLGLYNGNKKEIVIPAEYTDLVIDGQLISATKDGKKGVLVYRPTNGTIEALLPVEFDHILTFGDLVTVKRNDLYGLYRQSGNSMVELAPVEYTSITNDGKMYSLSKPGVSRVAKLQDGRLNTVLEGDFDSYRFLNENFGWNPLIEVMKDGKVGLYDYKSKKVVVPFGKYDGFELGEQNDDEMTVYKGTGDNKCKGKISPKNFAELIAPKYQEYYYIEGNFCGKDANGNWGLISKNGKTMIPFKYKKIEDGGSGTYIITAHNGNIGLYNNNRIVIDPAVYQDWGYLTNYNNEAIAYAIKKNGKWGGMTLKGKIFAQPKYRSYDRTISRYQWRSCFYFYDSNGFANPVYFDY